MTSPEGFGEASLFVTYGGSRRCNGNSSIGLGGAAHKETNYFWGTSPKSELLSCFIPTAAAVGSCKASEQSSSDEKGDVSDVIYTLTDFYRTPMIRDNPKE